MKDYREKNGAAISMTEDGKLWDLVKNVVREEKIKVIIESGTYQGLGSTRKLAEAYAEGLSPRVFCTCEASLSNYRSAVKNLARFPFVKCLWGNTVKLKEAISFIENDAVLRDHHLISDVFIDDTKDPVSYYKKECRSGLGSAGNESFLRQIDHLVRKLIYYQGEDLLRRLLKRYCRDSPLIVLDSAGGIGLLEFRITEEILRNYSFWLLLDDIHHLKHFRSFARIRSDPSFELIAYDQDQGWALAKHRNGL
ncbi:hypothetical protein ACFL42_01145 [Candidatus Omnitrophota bacterium]